MEVGIETQRRLMGRDDNGCDVYIDQHYVIISDVVGNVWSHCRNFDCIGDAEVFKSEVQERVGILGMCAIDVEYWTLIE